MQRRSGTVSEVFGAMLRLGCVAFGGPAAHIALFERELVERRRWVKADEFADLIAFCQFLPGPASSQVGMCLGMRRAGFFGMLAAWVGFSLPSVALLLLCATGLSHWAQNPGPWLWGLLAAVVAIVADAVLKMGTKLCPDHRTRSMATASACFMLLFPNAWAQLLVIGAGATLGLLLLDVPSQLGSAEQHGKSPMKRGALGWLILGALVLVPVFLAQTYGDASLPLALRVYAAFAKTGALVFGGGHVVLPMLEAEVVTPGWMSHEQFLTGYGVTQAMPGPIFTLSAFLGATVSLNAQAGPLGALALGGVAFLGIFMPSFGFVAGFLPAWDHLRQSKNARKALSGINASVVGLLAAALYDPVWTKAVSGEMPRVAVAIFVVSLLLLRQWKFPAWLTLAIAASLSQIAAFAAV